MMAGIPALRFSSRCDCDSSFSRVVKAFGEQHFFPYSAELFILFHTAHCPFSSIRRILVHHVPLQVRRFSLPRRRRGDDVSPPGRPADGRSLRAARPNPGRPAMAATADGRAFRGQRPGPRPRRFSVQRQGQQHRAEYAGAEKTLLSPLSSRGEWSRESVDRERGSQYPVVHTKFF